MPVKLHWFLPTNGDSRSDLSLGNAGGVRGRIGQTGGSDRAPDVGYIGQIARSAEQLGFDAALTPTSSSSPKTVNPWRSDHAHRVAVNVVSGWFADEFRQLGEPWLEHDERYRRSAETGTSPTASRSTACASSSPTCRRSPVSCARSSPRPTWRPWRALSEKSRIRWPD